jgi:hypothetical protein
LWKSGIQIVYIGLALLVVGCDDAKRSDHGVGAVSLEPAYIDLGSIPNGQSKVAVFKLRNNSSSTVKIDKLSTTCGCTEAGMSADVVEPGNSLEVRAKMSNYSRLGKFGAQVSANWRTISDNNSGTAVGIVEALAQQIAIVVPPVVEFENVSVESGVIEQDIQVRQGNAERRWRDVEVHSSSNSITWELASNTVDSPTVIRLRLDPRELSLGRYRTEIGVRLKDVEGHLLDEIKIPVKTLVKGTVDIKPSSVYLGVMNKGQVSQSEIILKTHDESSFEIEDIDDSKVKGKIVFEPIKGSAGESRLKFKLTAPSEPGDTSGEIVIALRVGGKREVINVPIVGFVKSE